MENLRAEFKAFDASSIDLLVPKLALEILHRTSQIISPTQICIAGGFARGLYMQQHLGLKPQMNDIDIFADLTLIDFERTRGELEQAFGNPVRFHIGKFEREEDFRGLIEFALPEALRAECAGVESIQLNFGAGHPWANPYLYINRANVGMNQIAITADGDVTATQAFIDDMSNRHMSMNSSRDWTTHDWSRTVKSLKRMQDERPEFAGWKINKVPEPYIPQTGTFWDNNGLAANKTTQPKCDPTA